MPLGQLSSALWRDSCELSLHPPSFAWSVKQPKALGRAAVLMEVTVAWFLLVCNYKQTPVSSLGPSISLESVAHTQAQQLHAIKVDGVTASVTGPLFSRLPGFIAPFLKVEITHLQSSVSWTSVESHAWAVHSWPPFYLPFQASVESLMYYLRTTKLS